MMNMSGFLDKEGLTYFWKKIKSILENKQDKLTAGDGISIKDNIISLSLDIAEEVGF